MSTWEIQVRMRKFWGLHWKRFEGWRQKDSCETYEYVLLVATPSVSIILESLTTLIGICTGVQEFSAQADPQRSWTLQEENDWLRAVIFCTCNIEEHKSAHVFFLIPGSSASRGAYQAWEGGAQVSQSEDSWRGGFILRACKVVFDRSKQDAEQHYLALEARVRAAGVWCSPTRSLDCCLFNYTWLFCLSTPTLLTLSILFSILSDCDSPTEKDKQDFELRIFREREQVTSYWL